MKKLIGTSWSQKMSVTFTTLVLMVGCGGSDDGAQSVSSLSSFNLMSIDNSASDNKTVVISWGSASNQSGIEYSVCEKDITMANSCKNLVTVTDSLSATVVVSNLVEAVTTDYFVIASNNSGAVVKSNEMRIDSTTLVDLIGYFKASNTGVDDAFGFSIALSGDGSTLAVGSSEEDNGVRGIISDGSEATDTGTASNSGAVYIYRNLGSGWTQTAYLKASNADNGDRFGYSLALNNDGSLLAVSAPTEDNSTTGILVDGSESSDSGTAFESGAVYLFDRTEEVWSQSAYVKASNTGQFDEFGRSIALSSDGLTLAVSAIAEDNAASGIITDGSEVIDTGTESASGAVYIFNNAGSGWSQTAYLKASNTGSNDLFGYSIALSDDGETLAVGAPSEDNGLSGTVTDGSELIDTGSKSGSGATYLFSKASGNWTQTVYIKASNSDSGDYFGRVVALSGNGLKLAVGSVDEDNGVTGIHTDGSELTDTGIKPDSGAVYLFDYSSGSWDQSSYIKASNSSSSDYFGGGIAFNSDGSVLAIGAYGEDGSATGVITDGSEVMDSNSLTNSGAVYLFSYSGGNWAQTAYVKASNPGVGDFFGSSNLGLSRSLALSADGNTLAVGSQNEDNGAVGIVKDGSEGSDMGTMSNSGAVYLY
ncbi:Integrin alpha beta-propellor [Vibrio coralliirubri]|uniref:hypothetical protein n=1 Tax=Vibrio coralliirubri TaxID=1516159 RepID=UPI0006333B21|nr:hypothetical protein [Vibrio coralliirubri]CDT33958.1 Integrin alpha beta-propellor [Vibrio coralliirubri]